MIIMEYMLHNSLGAVKLIGKDYYAASTNEGLHFHIDMSGVLLPHMSAKSPSNVSAEFFNVINVDEPKLA